MDGLSCALQGDQGRVGIHMRQKGLRGVWATQPSKGIKTYAVKVIAANCQRQLDWYLEKLRFGNESGSIGYNSAGSVYT